MIEREFPGNYAIAFAANGLEALEIMEQQHIDLMITDIRMPVMDGIELIHRVQKLAQRPEIMILSGHDDFQYAKEAIRCEVRMYLLKPIVRGELIEALDHLEKGLNRKEEQSQQYETYIRQLKEHAEAQLNYLFLQPEMGKAEVEEQLQALSLSGFQDGYQIALLRWPDGNLDRHVQQQRLIWFDSMLSQMGEASCKATLRFFGKDKDLIVLTGCRGLLLHLNSILQDRGGMRIKAGTSEWFSRLGDLKACYNQAEAALKYTIFHSYPAFVAYSTIAGKQSHYTLPIPTIQKIANMLGTDRHREIKQYCQAVFDLRFVALHDISYIEGISHAFNELVFDHVFNVYGEESVEILRLYKRVANMYSFLDFHDYYHHVESLLEKLNAYVNTMKLVHNDHRDMKLAIQYMQDNYSRDLNMAMVSNHVSLNYTYFSQAFKEYTKESFVHYLKKNPYRKSQGAAHDDRIEGA